MKVFWSWQSDTPGKVGRHFVRDALNTAIERLKETPEIEEPPAREARSAMHLDQDRKGIPGSPDLARVILEKIGQSSVFVADVTPVGVTITQAEETQGKKIINPNVAIELGYALHALGDRALLMVMNEHYGSRADLAFDLQSKAGPIMFNLAPDADRKTIAVAARQLTAQLARRWDSALRSTSSTFGSRRHFHRRRRRTIRPSTFNPTRSSPLSVIPASRSFDSHTREWHTFAYSLHMDRTVSAGPSCSRFSTPASRAQ
jgi:hypothetical protein